MPCDVSAASCGTRTFLIVQDFGARDPTAGEIGSGFGNKSLGNFDTAHVIRCTGKSRMSDVHRLSVL